MGLGIRPTLIRRLWSKNCSRRPLPRCADADAITAVSEDPAILRKAQVPLVLTPHPGEMARICHCAVSDVQADRLESASRFSREYGVVLVLKGHRTIIAAPDGKLAINSTGNPAMASRRNGRHAHRDYRRSACPGIRPFRAACLGVYVHGRRMRPDIRRGSRPGGFWRPTCWTKSPLY